LNNYIGAGATSLYFFSEINILFSSSKHEINSEVPEATFSLEATSESTLAVQRT
jgi:hypothetical protein